MSFAAIAKPPNFIRFFVVSSVRPVTVSVAAPVFGVCARNDTVSPVVRAVMFVFTDSVYAVPLPPVVANVSEPSIFGASNSPRAAAASADVTREPPNGVIMSVPVGTASTARSSVPAVFQARNWRFPSREERGISRTISDMSAANGTDRTLPIKSFVS
jgi:hypothetical protein